MKRKVSERIAEYKDKGLEVSPLYHEPVINVKDDKPYMTDKGKLERLFELQSCYIKNGQFQILRGLDNEFIVYEIPQYGGNPIYNSVFTHDEIKELLEYTDSLN